MGLPSLQLQRQNTEQLGTGNRNEGGRGTDGEWNNTPQFYGRVTDEENLSTVSSLSNTELYKDHQKTPIPLPPARAAPHLHPPHSLAVTLRGPVVPFVVGFWLFCEEHLVEAVEMKRTINTICEV